MNRADLITALAAHSDVSRREVDKVLTALTETITKTITESDDKIGIPGFVSFERTLRAARTTRNPQTGEPLQIPEQYGVKVSAGTKLRDAVKGK